MFHCLLSMHASRASAMRLYALISIASLKPARLLSVVFRVQASGGANAIEWSKKSMPPSFSRGTRISSATCPALVTSIGCRNATRGVPSVSFVTRLRFFFRSSSGLSGIYEKPQWPPSLMIRSAIAQAIDCLLNTPAMTPRLPANNDSMWRLRQSYDGCKLLACKLLESAIQHLTEKPSGSPRVANRRHATVAQLTTQAIIPGRKQHLPPKHLPPIRTWLPDPSPPLPRPR